jgi:hypothetical protein
MLLQAYLPSYWIASIVATLAVASHAEVASIKVGLAAQTYPQKIARHYGWRQIRRPGALSGPLALMRYRFDLALPRTIAAESTINSNASSCYNPRLDSGCKTGPYEAFWA